MDTNSELQGAAQSRRRFISGISTLGACSLLPITVRASAEPPPETTQLTLFESTITCLAPQYVAQELLRAEGFTDIRYLKWGRDTQSWVPELLYSGKIDISLVFLPPAILQADLEDSLVILGGSHIGCVELVGGNGVRSTADLKGKTVAISQPRAPDQLFISMFAAYVGIDPKDINWVAHASYADNARLLTQGRIDAFMTGPPYALELREKKIGHILVNTTSDKPWSQYFCCAIASTKEFVSRHPIATKRALRALLKAADVCATEPERVARLTADRGLGGYDYILRSLREIPYARWRDYNPEDAVRFFALRLHEVGFVKSSPQQIIARCTDWRFLNELKKELKA